VVEDILGFGMNKEVPRNHPFRATEQSLRCALGRTLGNSPPAVTYSVIKVCVMSEHN
jgi:hypothetical protein